MKLIKPSFEIWEQDSYNESKSELLSAIYKQIERVGRVCYKSEDKITDDSAQPFVQRLIASKHYAMLEHGTVYLTIPITEWRDIYDYEESNGYLYNPYSRVNDGEVNWEAWKGDVYITTNYRVLVENNWLDDLDFMVEPTKHHEQRHTVHFICNRQVSHEFVRHRVFSFAQESTRYCNYTKGHFGGELTFIKPCWEPEDYSSTVLCSNLDRVEHDYFELINNQGWKPQQAATILPNALKTELVMTGLESDWKHFFELRALGTTGAPHPQAKELAEPLMQEFIKKGWYHAN